MLLLTFTSCESWWLDAFGRLSKIERRYIDQSCHRRSEGDDLGEFPSSCILFGVGFVEVSDESNPLSVMTKFVCMTV